MKKMRGEVHWSVYPEGIVELTRQMYWFEEKKQEAIDILRCFDGISDDQINKILNGDATLREHLIGARYEESFDLEFKAKLQDHQHYLESKYVTLAGCRVPKELLEQYAEHVVKRLRDTMRQRIAGYVETEPALLLDIYQLEQLRREMHEAILKAVGFDPKLKYNQEGYSEFQVALGEYLDSHAGTLMSW